MPFERKWMVLSVVTLVAFITNIDATIVVVGLPQLIHGLHISLTAGLWTLTAYILTSTVFLLPAGRWADQFGGKRIFMAGLAIFTGSTALCGIAPTGDFLIASRLLQGIGAALSLATATPMIVRVFPRQELGRALGINSTSWVMGSIIGPVAGGVLVSSLDWRWIFFVTVPFGLLGLIGAGVVLKNESQPPKAPNDWMGLLTFVTALTSLLVMLSEGQMWGWTSLRTLALCILGVVMIVVFIKVERHHDGPLFDLRLFSQRPFALGLGVTVSYAIGFFATTFLLTIYLQGPMHLNVLDAGLMLIPLSAPQLIMGPMGGIWADRFGSPRLILVGILVLVLGGGLLTQLGNHFTIWSVGIPLVVISIGNGLAWPALTKGIMSSIPTHQTGIASGMFYTFRNVGMAFSLTLSLAFSEMSVPPQVAARVFVGTQGMFSLSLRSAVVRSTDGGFTMFLGFYILALILAYRLLRGERSSVSHVSSLS